MFNLEPDRRRPVKDILSKFLRKYPRGCEDDIVVRKLKEAGVWDLDAGCWDDEYDILGYLPPCPRCRAKMRFNDAADMLQCPDCGYSIEGSDYPYRDMPSWNEITEDDYKK